MLKILPFESKYLEDAANLFIHHFQALRRAVPVLSDQFENLDYVVKRLEGLFVNCPGAAAIEDGRLAGYLGWYLLSDFRRTGRKGAYCPEWGHAAAPLDQARIYRALYRKASIAWFNAGCLTHSISLLAHNREAIDAWFWNGFGLAVVDGVRPAVPLDVHPVTDLEIRKATVADAETLAILESEHVRHYGQPPTLMVPPDPDSATQFADLLHDPRSSAWLAWDGAQPAGYLRFEGSGFGAADVLTSDQCRHNTGAFVRPAYRGRRAAPAMLDAALRDFAASGLTCCSVDFESFNPEAAAFWPRYFEPVSLGLFRVPEQEPPVKA